MGICKIYTNYTVGAKGKLKSKGSVSFIRTEEIDKEKFIEITNKLDALGIKLEKYNGANNKQQRCSIFLNNFYKGDIDIPEK